MNKGDFGVLPVLPGTRLWILVAELELVITSTMGSTVAVRNVFVGEINGCVCVFYPEIFYFIPMKSGAAILLTMNAGGDPIRYLLDRNGTRKVVAKGDLTRVCQQCH